MIRYSAVVSAAVMGSEVLERGELLAASRQQVLLLAVLPHLAVLLELTSHLDPSFFSHPKVGNPIDDFSELSVEGEHLALDEKILESFHDRSNIMQLR